MRVDLFEFWVKIAYNIELNIFENALHLTEIDLILDV